MTLWAPVVLIANGLITPVLLANYYVRPFQKANGDLLAGGSLNWATGEMALMTSWGVIWVALGLFAIRYIRRAYSPVERLS
jgi:hypothetical protein